MLRSILLLLSLLCRVINEGLVPRKTANHFLIDDMQIGNAFLRNSLLTLPRRDDILQLQTVHVHF